MSDWLKNKLHINLYDVLLFVMMLLLIGGSTGGFFQPVRLLFIGLAPVFLYEWFHDATLRQKYRLEYIFFALWIIYAAISLIWRKNGIECIKLFIHLCIYLTGFMEVMWLCMRAKRPLESITLGWLAMFCCFIPIGLWELITDQHLSTCSTSALQLTYIAEHDAIRRHFTATTFDNLNAFNVVLCYTILPMLYALSQSKKTIQFIVCSVLAVFNAFFIYWNGSRAAFLCWLIAMAIYLVMEKRKTARVICASTIALLTLWHLIIAFGCIRPTVINTSAETKEWALKYGDPSLIVTNADGKYIGYINKNYNFSGSVMSHRMQSEGVNDLNRVYLYTIAWNECVRSHLLGVGIGNIPYVYAQQNSRWLAPHCLWLEILMNFGILIFIGYACMLLAIFIHGIRSGGEPLLFALLSLWMLVGASISDGTIVFKAHFWMYFALIYIYSKHLTTNHSNKTTQR